jgi:predicted GNAT family acetyltransferase
MRAHRINDAAEMLAKVQEVLERDEATNNLSLGLLLRYAHDPAYGIDRDPPFFALVEDRGLIPLVMVRTPPHHMIVYGEGELLDEAIQTAISFLLDEGLPVPGVIGPRDVAERFASAWRERTECVLTVLMEQLIYQLDEVSAIEPSPGELIVATEEHLELMAKWLVGFSQVTHDPVELEQARKDAARTIAARRAVLWVDGEPVSMAWRTRSTRNGIVVSGVYTPPALRGLGYATSCVAALSRQLLEEGYHFCSLYADLSNPTSNSIYRRIGYRPIRSSIVIRFD